MNSDDDASDRTPRTVTWRATAADSSTNVDAPVRLPAGIVVEITVRAFVPELGRHEELAARWDNHREVVRSAVGNLLWYRDENRLAYRDRNKVVVTDSEGALLPKGLWGVEGVALRSLDDLCDYLNLEYVESRVGQDVVLAGSDGSRGYAQLLPGSTGIIERASGLSPMPWQADLLSHQQVSAPEAEPWFELADL